jgi:hypothetical protein
MFWGYVQNIIFILAQETQKNQEAYVMVEHVETQERVYSQGHLRFLKTVIGIPTWINGHFFNTTNYVTWQMHVYAGVHVENDMQIA